MKLTILKKTSYPERINRLIDELQRINESDITKAERVFLKFKLNELQENILFQIKGVIENDKWNKGKSA